MAKKGVSKVLNITVPESQKAWVKRQARRAGHNNASRIIQEIVADAMNAEKQTATVKCR